MLLFLFLFFVQRSYAFCCTLLDVPCLTPLGAWFHFSSCYTLLDVVAPLTIPYSTLLFFLLFFVWWCCHLFNIITHLAAPFTAPCSMLLLFLLLLVWHCCFSIAPCLTLLLILLLFGQHYYSSYYSLVNIAFQRSLVDVVVPLHVQSWHSLLKYLYITLWCSYPFVFYRWYYSYSSCFKLVSTPICRCGKNSLDSNFQAKFRRWDFIFQYLFVNETFYYPCCFWEILVDNVFVYCVQELFGHCMFNYTHYISFTQLHCVFFQHITSFF